MEKPASLPMSRASFLLGGTAAASVPSAELPAIASPRDSTTRRGRRALILSGGANRGVYAAGAITALAETAGLRDGQPLPYDLVCGTSIGALNGYFVATAQYSQLRRLWELVSTRPVFEPKSPYNHLANNASGIGTRLYAAFHLAIGLLQRVKGVVNPRGVRDLLHEEFKPAETFHIPLYISVTNITRQRNEMFVLRATSAGGIQRQEINDRLLDDFHRDPIRTVDEHIFYDVFFATAALPLVFDPVLIPHQDDPTKADEYIDGGITKNIPADIALHCADAVHTMLVEPLDSRVEIAYANASEIGLGVFSTMQRRIIELGLYLAYADKRSSTTPLPFKASIIQPAQELPGEFGDFSDRVALQRGWEMGYRDGLRGWRPFEPPIRGLVTND
ncbi:MAG: patatin-like phospholipase family protein [Candidatus Eremiobacteraeota bacterium]|nr:patatin-like phospholipase family protein [Candidatus Eremiobacteraeota bacterium]